MYIVKGSQRRYLRGLASTLKPVLQIGKNGLTEEVVQAADQALDSHELIKVKFLEFKDEKKELSLEIAAQTNSELVGIIGHNALFFRPKRQKEKRKIQLSD